MPIVKQRPARRRVLESSEVASTPHWQPRPKPKPLVNTKGSFDIRQPNKVDWLALKTEFMADLEHTKPRTFLREVWGWSNKKLSSGYVISQISGWGEEKANFRQRIHDDAIAELRKTEKYRAVELLKAKGRMIDRFIYVSNNLSTCTVHEVIAMLKVIKTELGEPTSIRHAPTEAPPEQTDLPQDVVERLIRDARRESSGD